MAAGTAILLSLQAPAGAVAQFAGGPARGGILQTEGVPVPGRERWAVQTDGPVRSSPVVAQGVVFVGSDDGGLYAIDARTGQLRWRFETGAPVRSAPAVADDLVYVTNHRGDLHAVGRHDGALRWRRPAGVPVPWPWGLEGWDYVGSSPALAGGVVVSGGPDGAIRAFDARTGAERWTVATGGPVRSSPAIANGRVHVGSADGVLRALALDSGQEVWRFVTRGAELESARFGFDRRTISGGPAIVGDRLYVGSRDARMYALDLRTGRELWANDDSSSAWVISTPAVTNGRVIFGRSSSAKVQALDAVSGARLWEVRLAGAIQASPLVIDDVAYVTSGASGEVVALDVATGAFRWRRRLPAASFSSPTGAGGALIFGSDDGVIRALEATTGAAPRLAVFHDSTIRARSLLGLRGASRTIATELAASGYQLLDSAGLGRFLRERLADHAPSVVVMATDLFPNDLAPEPILTGVLAQYLADAGRIVWVGDPPFWAFRADTTTGFTLSTERPSRFLGFSHDMYVRDERLHRATPAGQAWGIAGWWTGSGGIDADAATTVLATDDEGRASSWVRAYGGGPGSGWVAWPYHPGAEWLHTLRRVAETGITRALPQQQSPMRNP